MANKKIWAYGKNSSNEYIKDSIDRNRMFFIWEALKMRRENPVEYKNITFWSTQNNEENRSKMTAVKTGFFRYIENQNGNTFSGDGESLSHSIAILAISRLSELNFTIGKNKLKIKPTHIFIDDLKVQFENGNYYYPDLICEYNSPLGLIEKWGNKIALEVKVSHACEEIKIKDFEDHNYPIIEITLNENMQFLKELRKEQFDENDLKKYYDFILDKFSKNIYAKILSNPVKVKYHKKIVKKLNSEIDSLKSKIQDIENNFNETLRRNDFKVKSIETELEKETEIKKLILKENTELKNKSFLRKLKELFK